MKHSSDPQFDLLRIRLLGEYNEIEDRLSHNEHFGKADSLREETGELSTIDNHPGDVATEMYEREKDISLLELEELHLRRIEAALTAMDNGTYGFCAVCGNAIPNERLNALPDTLYCVNHSSRSIVSDRRPVEEQFLQPPFGRSSLDEHEGYNGFDGEDAWQIVEQWGNSDSPAMSENTRATDYDHLGIESEENDGFVEPIESFLATDITGRHISVVRNREYDHYMHSDEGDHSLEYNEK